MSSFKTRPKFRSKSSAESAGRRAWSFNLNLCMLTLLIMIDVYRPCAGCSVRSKLSNYLTIFIFNNAISARSRVPSKLESGTEDSLRDIDGCCGLEPDPSIILYYQGYLQSCLVHIGRVVVKREGAISASQHCPQPEVGWNWTAVGIQPRVETTVFLRWIRPGLSSSFCPENREEVGHTKLNL